MVFVALTMVALMGFTALGVDGGAVWSDHKQLQNGADAGALAIAQACANGDCGDYTTAANQFARTNKIDTNATGVVTDLNTAQGYVTVRTSSTRDLWFAPVVGIQTANIAATATAKWEPKSGGAFLPLAFSLCSFWAQSGAILGDPIPSDTSMTLHLKSKDPVTGAISSDPSVCLPNTDAAHNEVAGGFGWLDVPSAATCMTSVSVGQWVDSDPGGNVPCDFGTSLQGTTVQIPVFDQCTTGPNGSCAGGSNAQYHIYAIASFTVTGYCFSPNTAEWQVAHCNSSDPYIQGVFVSFTSADSTQGDGSAPELGADQVALTK